jgi:hypothetical protein
VTIGDVTNDGIADVVVANYFGQANQLFVGDAGGGLTLDTSSPIATGSDKSKSVTIGDVTNDGIADVVVANYFGQANQLFGGASCKDNSLTRTQHSGEGFICTPLSKVLSIVDEAVPMGCPWIGGTCAECPAGRFSNELSTLCPTHSVPMESTAGLVRRSAKPVRKESLAAMLLESLGAMLLAKGAHCALQVSTVQKLASCLQSQSAAGCAHLARIAWQERCRQW